MALTKVSYADNETIISAKNLNDIQDAIIALEAGVDPETDGDVRLFIATYGETTLDELDAADDAGKFILVDKGLGYYMLSEVFQFLPMFGNARRGYAFSKLLRTVTGRTHLQFCRCGRDGWEEQDDIELASTEEVPTKMPYRLWRRSRKRLG